MPKSGVSRPLASPPATATSGHVRFFAWYLTSRLCLRFVPGSRSRPPPTYVPAILFIVSSEFPLPCCVFIKDHEEMYAEGNRHHSSNQCWIGMSKHNPQPDPPRCEAQVHWVSHVAVEPNRHQPLRRSDRSRRSASRPPEVPDAAQRNRESQHRRNCRQPSQIGCPSRCNPETEPPGQQPEPQAEERRAHCQRRQRGRPSIAVRDRNA